MRQLNAAQMAGLHNVSEPTISRILWLRVKPADRAWRSHSNMSVIAPLLAAQLIGTRFRKRPFKPLAAFPFLYVR